MQCPECHAPNQTGKHCSQCGATLRQICPQCGQLVPLTARFCESCGHALAAPAAPAPEETRLIAPPAPEATLPGAAETPAPPAPPAPTPPPAAETPAPQPTPAQPRAGGPRQALAGLGTVPKALLIGAAVCLIWGLILFIVTSWNVARMDPPPPPSVSVTTPEASSAVREVDTSEESAPVRSSARTERPAEPSRSNRNLQNDRAANPAEDAPAKSDETIPLGDRPSYNPDQKDPIDFVVGRWSFLDDRIRIRKIGRHEYRYDDEEKGIYYPISYADGIYTIYLEDGTIDFYLDQFDSLVDYDDDIEIAYRLNPDGSIKTR